MAQTLSQFVKAWTGKTADFDGAYGGQCVDLANFYQRDVIGGPWIGTPLTNGARDWWENFNNSPQAKAHYIQVSKTAKPQDGDVPVWGSSVGGGYGHIAIYYHGKIFNQNNAGRQYATLDNMFTSGLLGYLRPKKFVSINPVPGGGTTTVERWNKISNAKAYIKQFYVIIRGAAPTQREIDSHYKNGTPISTVQGFTTEVNNARARDAKVVADRDAKAKALTTANKMLTDRDEEIARLNKQLETGTGSGDSDKKLQAIKDALGIK